MIDGGSFPFLVLFPSLSIKLYPMHTPSRCPTDNVTQESPASPAAVAVQ